MNDPSTYWLTFTNIALGVVTLICCVAVGVGIVQEIVARRTKGCRLSNLDREVADLVSTFGDGHAFQLPGLGVTMADGGEELGKKETVTAMTCPFLKEAQVKYCRTASVRKLIPLAPAGRADEKCSSADHATCSGFERSPRTSPLPEPAPSARVADAVLRRGSGRQARPLQRIAALALRQR